MYILFLGFISSPALKHYLDLFSHILENVTVQIILDTFP